MQHTFAKITETLWRDQHGCEATEGVTTDGAHFLRTTFPVEPSNFWWLGPNETASGTYTLRSPSRLARQHGF